ELTVPAASGDSDAAKQFDALHEQVAEGRRKISDMMSALVAAEATGMVEVDTARRVLRAAQIEDNNANCIAEAERFDRALAEAVEAGERLSALHEERLALQHFDASRMNDIAAVRGANRLLAAIPTYILKIANPIVWPSGYIPLAKSEAATLGI